MKIKIFVNEKLYKTIDSPDGSYQHHLIVQEVMAARAAGLLNSYGLTTTLPIRIEKQPK